MQRTNWSIKAEESLPSREMEIWIEYKSLVYISGIASEIQDANPFEEAERW